MQGTRVYSDPLLSSIDEESSLSKIPICRFAYPNFAKLIGDNVLREVVESEKNKHKGVELQRGVDWINEQIIDRNLLKGVKVGVLGLGKLGSHLAKTFKVKRIKCMVHIFFGI